MARRAPVVSGTIASTRLTGGAAQGDHAKLTSVTLRQRSQQVVRNGTTSERTLPMDIDSAGKKGPVIVIGWAVGS